MGFNTWRTHWVPLLLAKNKNLRPHWAQDHPDWKLEDCKNMPVFFSNLQSSSFIEPVCVMFCDWSGSVMCHTFSYSGSRKSFGSTRTLNWINNSRQVCCFIRILPFTRPVLPYKSCNAHMVWKTENEPQHTQKNDHKAEDKRVNKEKEVNDRRWRWNKKKDELLVRS